MLYLSKLHMPITSAYENMDIVISMHIPAWPVYLTRYECKQYAGMYKNICYLGPDSKTHDFNRIIFQQTRQQHEYKCYRPWLPNPLLASYHLILTSFLVNHEQVWVCMRSMRATFWFFIYCILTSHTNSSSTIHPQKIGPQENSSPENWSLGKFIPNISYPENSSREFGPWKIGA